MFFLLLLSNTAFAQLSNHSANCPPFHHWVKPHHRSAYYRSNGTFVSATFISGHCRVNQKSYAIWGNSFTNRPITNWPHQEAMKAWTEAEKELVLETLDQIPNFLSQLKNVNLYRGTKSIVKGNHASSLKDMIVLYDSSMNSEKLLKRVLIHELAHVYYSRLRDMQKTIINESVGWSRRNDILVPGDRAEYLLDDSRVSPEEDFANVIELYFNEPLVLKHKSPIVFDWISTQFVDKIKE